MEYNLDQDPGPKEVIGGNPLIDPFLSKGIIPPKPYEYGWKDTVIALPKQVTRIAVRFANQSGDPFPFDATAVGNPVDGIVGTDGGEGPCYVWHCHIIDHEDNEMMRPYCPVNNSNNELD
jgi:FtsP/CotA-like multicopper oxidase with cupredoxin domain